MPHPGPAHFQALDRTGFRLQLGPLGEDWTVRTIQLHQELYVLSSCFLSFLQRIFYKLFSPSE